MLEKTDDTDRGIEEKGAERPIIKLVDHIVAEGIAGGVDLVLADDDTSWLSAMFVRQARDAGVAVIGFFDPEEADGFGRQHLARLGISSAVSATVEVEQLVDLIRQSRPDPDLQRAGDERALKLSA